jgi:hypothetical protein
MTDIETPENVFEAKAQGIVDIWVGDNTGVGLDMSDLVSAIADAFAAERLEEREECGAICDAYAAASRGHTAEENAARELAASIRYRKD